MANVAHESKERLWFVKSGDKRGTYRITYPRIPVLRPRNSSGKPLTRGDQGINPLDTVCREHDIAYSRSNDLGERHAADNVLADKARKCIIARDSTLGERGAARAV